MNNSQKLNELIVDEVDKLALLVKENGLNCHETVFQSQKLDKLILEYQQQFLLKR